MVRAAPGLPVPARIDVPAGHRGVRGRRLPALPTGLEPAVTSWAETETAVLILNYDENDGLFDQVLPRPSGRHHRRVRRHGLPPASVPAATAGEARLSGAVRHHLAVDGGRQGASKTIGHTCVPQALKAVDRRDRARTSAGGAGGWGCLITALHMSEPCRERPELP
ncbi:alkaline phosphatase family protein [Streptomyces sp. NPDC003393]